MIDSKTRLTFDPPVIGHRGACAYAPENTFVSFAKAAQLGVKWVEFDVMQAASGELVVFHDERLERTTDGRGEVIQSGYAYLRSLDAGAWFDPVYAGERIPTLLTVIDFLQNMGLCANIEIKASPGNEERIAERVLSEMAPYLAAANQRFLFSSFSMRTLKFLRESSSHCHIGLLWHGWRSDWAELARSLQYSAVSINEAILTKERAHSFKKDTNRPLLAYTVNSPVRARALFDWGVDAVFSDAPDKIINI
jgi:glycerophosphoryl diester phosphodiesterase